MRSSSATVQHTDVVRRDTLDSGNRLLMYLLGRIFVQEAGVSSEVY